MKRTSGTTEGRIALHFPRRMTFTAFRALFASMAALLVAPILPAKSASASEDDKPASSAQPPTLALKPSLAETASRAIAAHADTALPAPPVPKACQAAEGAIGVERVVEIDASTGPLFGNITKERKEPRFLRPKEVVLTFDDGPVPWITGPILETLARHCTRATFFSVGRMARAYPQTLQAVVEQGHTVAGHTWSHPLNLRRLSHDKAVAQIERGFSAIAAAVDGELAPFFRFPGLSDSGRLLAHLQDRGIAAFSVDVVSDDSFINDPDELARITLNRIRAASGGIVLFHDIKPSTAKALPKILDTLASEGFKVVHLRATQRLEPLAEYPAPPIETGSAKTNGAPDSGAGEPPLRQQLVTFFGATYLERALDPAVVGRPVTIVNAPARERLPNRAKSSTAPRKPPPPPVHRERE